MARLGSNRISQYMSLLNQFDCNFTVESQIYIT
jgi:hypothetical protein